MAELIKAISLYQPHASLVAIGAKRFETRSWQTHHRGLVLIHAAGKREPSYMTLAQSELFRTALKKEPFWSARRMQVVAAALLANCVKIGNSPPPEVVRLGSYELPFGDFSPGRYAFELSHVVQFREPFYARGSRKMFNVPAYQVLLATEDWDRCPAWWKAVNDSPGCRCKHCQSKGEARGDHG